MRPWVALAGWAALLALWTAVQLLFSPALLTVLLLGGASLAVFTLAAVVAVAVRPVASPPTVTPPVAAAPRRSPRVLSPATPLLAIAVAAIVSGAELGTWCILLGALVGACGLAALAFEVRR
ncbi:MAG TPA: hypothetical protein VNS09_20695 [Solirubrobacter sp.]|nr:hypothetical protein [Solirubrobacter sp.]